MTNYYGDRKTKYKLSSSGQWLIGKTTIQVDENNSTNSTAPQSQKNNYHNQYSQIKFATLQPDLGLFLEHLPFFYLYGLVVCSFISK